MMDVHYNNLYSFWVLVWLILVRLPYSSQCLLWLLNEELIIAKKDEYTKYMRENTLTPEQEWHMKSSNSISNRPTIHSCMEKWKIWRKSPNFCSFSIQKIIFYFKSAKSWFDLKFWPSPVWYGIVDMSFYAHSVNHFPFNRLSHRWNCMRKLIMRAQCTHIHTFTGKNAWTPLNKVSGKFQQTHKNLLYWQRKTNTYVWPST